MKCPRCQQEAPSEAAFCPKCGAKLSVPCAQCDTANAPDDNFCRKCGQQLAPATSTTATRFASPESYTPKHPEDAHFHSSSREEQLYEFKEA